MNTTRRLAVSLLALVAVLASPTAAHRSRRRAERGFTSSVTALAGAPTGVAADVLEPADSSGEGGGGPSLQLVLLPAVALAVLVGLFRFTRRAERTRARV